MRRAVGTVHFRCHSLFFMPTRGAKQLTDWRTSLFRTGANEYLFLTGWASFGWKKTLGAKRPGVEKKMSELGNEDRASLPTGAEASPVSTDLGKSGGATIGWSERAKKTWLWWA